MSALPQLKLEADPHDPAQLHLVFDPAPSAWSFDASKGTREELRAQLTQQIDLFMSNAAPDARFDDAAQQTLRTNIRHLLLQWIGFRGLRIPAGG